MAADFRTALNEWQAQMTPATCKVTKLNDKNYTRWKKEMMMHLKAVNLWSVVNEDLPDAVNQDASWHRRNDRAWTDIYGACESDQQEFIVEYEFAKQAWERLKALYESRDSAAVQGLLSEWNSLQKKPTETMQNFIARVKSVARRLNAAGDTISTPSLLNKIIGGLDASYDSFKMTLCLIPDLTEDRLTQTLMSEEARRQASANDDLRLARRQALIREQSRRDLEDLLGKHRPRRRDRSASPDAEDGSLSKRDRKGNSTKYCDTCRVWGHTEDTCYSLHPKLLAQRRSEQALRRLQASAPKPLGNNVPRLPSQPRPPHVLAVADHTVSNELDPVEPPPTSGYAMPMQFDEDLLWEYYNQAMVLTANLHSCLSVHQHTNAIATFETNDVKADNPPLEDNSIHEGDYIQVPRSGDWLIDSGASNHYTSSRYILADFQHTPDIAIQTGSGVVYGKGIGNVTIHSSLGLRKINDVIWVPQLAGKHNLLSIPQLVRKGCKVTMSGTSAAIFSDDSEKLKLLEGIFRKKGYFIQMSLCNQTTHLAKLVMQLVSPGQHSLVPMPLKELAMLAGTEDTQPLEIWHLRLGHLNQAAIHQLVTRATGCYEWFQVGGSPLRQH